MITITLDRTSGTATTDAAPGMLARGPDPWFCICRALTNARHPDGPAVFVDDRGVRCMTVKSIHAAARRYRPLPRIEQRSFGL